MGGEKTDGERAGLVSFGQRRRGDTKDGIASRATYSIRSLVRFSFLGNSSETQSLSLLELLLGVTPVNPLNNLYLKFRGLNKKNVI